MNKILKILLILNILIFKINANDFNYNDDFTNKLLNNKNLYTISVAYVTKERIGGFINENIKGDQYAIIKVSNLYKIIYGIYKSELDAKKDIENLFSYRKDKTKIVKINFKKEDFKKENINSSKTFKNDTIVILSDTYLYNNSDKKSKIIKTLKRKYYSRIYDKKLLSNSKYPWYKIEDGWVNTPYLYKVSNKNIYLIKNSNENKKIIVDKKDNSSKINLLKNVSEEIDKKIVKIEKRSDLEKQNINNEKNKKRLYSNFVGVSVGYSYMDAKKEDTNGNIFLNREIDKAGLNINIEAGKRTKNYIFTFNYTNLLYDDTKFNRFLIGINRTFNQYQYKPYIGLLSGLSYIEITKAHFNTNISKATGKEVAYGIQSGLEYKITNNLFIHPYIRYLRSNHTTILKSNPALAKINRDNHININIGLRYNLY